MEGRDDIQARDVAELRAGDLVGLGQASTSQARDGGRILICSLKENFATLPYLGGMREALNK